MFAGKVIEKASLEKPKKKQKLMFEIKIHKQMAHDNIVKFYRFFEDKDNVYILLELCENKSLGELMNYRRVLIELEVRYYIKQII